MVVLMRSGLPVEIAGLSAHVILVSEHFHCGSFPTSKWFESWKTGRSVIRTVPKRNMGHFRAKCCTPERIVPIGRIWKYSSLDSPSLNPVDEISQILAIFLGRAAVPTAAGTQIRLDSDPGCIEVTRIKCVKHLGNLLSGVFGWAAFHVNVSRKTCIFCIFEVLRSVGVDCSVVHIGLDDDKSGSLLGETGEGSFGSSWRYVKTVLGNGYPTETAQSHYRQARVHLHWWV